MEILYCENCNAEVSPVEVHCERCGFPLAGTEKEKAIFIGRQTVDQSTLSEASQYQKRSSIILYIVGGLQIFAGILSYMNNEFMLELLIYLFIGLAFIVFGILARKKPVLFIGLGLSFLLGLYIMDVIYDPSTLGRGIIWKMILVGTLVYGLISSIKERNIRKRNRSL